MVSRHTFLFPSTTPLLAVPAFGADPGEKYPLLAGVREFPEATELWILPYGENDVTELAQVLQANRFKRQNGVLMTQVQGAEVAIHPPSTADPHGTELRLILRGRNSADTVVLTFAGHVVQLREDKESYFCPADTQLNVKSTLLLLKETYEELEGCKAGVHLLLVQGSARREGWQNYLDQDVV